MINNNINQVYYEIKVDIDFQECGEPEEPYTLEGIYQETSLSMIKQAVEVIKQDSFGFWCEEHNIDYDIKSIDDKTIFIKVNKSDKYPIEDMIGDLKTIDHDGNYPVYYEGEIFLVIGKNVRYTEGI